MINKIPLLARNLFRLQWKSLAIVPIHSIVFVLETLRRHGRRADLVGEVDDSIDLVGGEDGVGALRTDVGENVFQGVRIGLGERFTRSQLPNRFDVVVLAEERLGLVAEVFGFFRFRFQLCRKSGDFTGQFLKVVFVEMIPRFWF